MKKLLWLVALCAPLLCWAAPGDFVRGRVINVQDSPQDKLFPDQIGQRISVRVLEGDKKGVTIEVPPSEVSIRSETQKLSAGDQIILTETEKGFGIFDRYRLPAIAWILAVFLAAVGFIGRWTGLRSMLGLLLSIGVIAKGIIPAILAGHSPLLVSLIGGFGIAGISIYLAHGFRKRTSIAVLSTILTLVLAFGISLVFVYGASLFGLGSEESMYLQVGLGAGIDLRGLLLGAILIGTIGVLDDVTTTQVAAVDEVRKAQPNLGNKELYRRGFSVGREHIASMINTLALAYVSTALPMFLLLAMNADRPLWVLLSSEFFAEEIVRTVAGSMALIFAVPISTGLAAFFLGKKYETK
ncbi:MAG: YibE/F family protein [Candidatus Gracilibacteria bacterium]|nr:YibE/F family protein [Candidatus Gracilibacteria bacterium]